MTALLDTNIIIDVLKLRNGRIQQLIKFVGQENRVAVTSVVVTEVFMGATPKQLPIAVELLNSLQFIPVTRSIAERAGLIYYEWRAKGHTLSLPDVTIAAICIENGIPLITDNVRHFPMPELTRITLPREG